MPSLRQTKLDRGNYQKGGIRIRYYFFLPNNRYSTDLGLQAWIISFEIKVLARCASECMERATSNLIGIARGIFHSKQTANIKNTQKFRYFLICYTSKNFQNMNFFHIQILNEIF